VDVNSYIANTWSQALRFADEQEIEPEDLPEFLKKEGGLEACSRKFRESRDASTRDGRGAHNRSGNSDAMPTIRIKTLGVRMNFSPKFIEGLDKLKTKKISQKIKVEGEFSTAGLMVLKSVISDGSLPGRQDTSVKRPAPPRRSPSKRVPPRPHRPRQ
jgi:hypothetical protein